ncbi:MAG: hypothetical protein SFZ24_03390 [Planctomycetota bacterium]|nr:hypothetical protein [Planctomycetota bacterium]
MTALIVLASEGDWTAAQGIAALPWYAHVAVGLTLGAGLLLWVSGHRLMRPMLMALGAVAGSVTGHLAPAVLDPTGTGLALTAAGAVCGAIAGWVLFRLLVAQTLAGVVAVAAVLGTAAFVRTGGAGTEAGEPVLVLAAPEAAGAEGAESVTGAEVLALLREERLTHAEALRLARAMAAHRIEEMMTWARGAAAEQMERASEEAESGESAGGAGAEVGGEALPEVSARRGGEIIGAFVRHAAWQLWAFWNEDVTPSGRIALMMSAVLGYLGGLALGLALPKRAAAVTTALLGAAVWLPSAAYLAIALGLPMSESMPADPGVWLLAWAAVAGAGLLWQLARSGGKRAAKPTAA